MKKLVILVATFIMLLSMVLPSIALAVSSSVTVSTGGGAIPAVKCKWEQQPAAVNSNLEDGDSPHAVPGFQLNPPGVACAVKMIEYYAVVTDEEDGGNLAQTFADVFHPVGSPEPYGPTKIGGIENLPYFKYEVPFWDMQTGTSAITKATAIDIVNNAYSKGLITFGAFSIEDVRYELDKGTAHLWKGQKVIDYEQPAGNYDVRVFTVDSNNNLSPVLANQFTYVAIPTIEVDFSAINWGSVNLGVEKMIPGDTIWNKPLVINDATVRNVGNTWVSVKVRFSDMGFGQDANGNWNVQFDARMGSNDTYYEGNIMPNTDRTLVNALKLSHKDELDLSIKIIKGFGTHSGTITLSPVARPFTYSCADGIPSLRPGDCPTSTTPG